MPKLLRTQFYGTVERANATIGHFRRPVARPAVLAKPRLAPPLLAKAEFAMLLDSRLLDRLVLEGQSENAVLQWCY